MADCRGGHPLTALSLRIATRASAARNLPSTVLSLGRLGWGCVRGIRV